MTAPAGEPAGALPCEVECSAQQERTSAPAFRGFASQRPPIKRQGEAGNAASTVGRAASKARTPLLASGAAIAGVAGGIALGARQTRRSKLLQRRPKVKIGPKVKIDSHDLAKAAKEVGQFGVDVGQLASELRRNREAANGAKRRSPIEVVLQGLTSRGNSS